MVVHSVGIAFATVGIGVWIWTVRTYLNDPGYGGFDMNTAPAFDYGWFKGTLFLSLGVGLLSRSWPIGIGSVFVAFLSVMLVKPVLGSWTSRRISRVAAEEEKNQPPMGFKALSAVEQEFKSEDDDK